MRKILVFPRNGVAALRAALRQASLAAFGASLTVTLCCSSDATAQTHAYNVTPAAAMNYQDAPVSGRLPQPLNKFAASDATYSVAEDRSSVQQAQYGGAGFIDSAMNRVVTRAGDNQYGASDPCTAGCDVTGYGSAEALWLNRSNDKYFSLSQDSRLSDFDYRLGGRFTFGRLFNCVDGWEGVYVGPYDWNRQATKNGNNDLQSRFIPNEGYGPAQIDTFNNASKHVQSWESKLNSFEVNRRWWSWDVLSTLIGMRYVDYSENFLLQSTSLQGAGTYSNQVKNRMAGAQIGADIFYPVSLRGNVGFRGKAGVYANFDETNVFMRNAATTIVNAGDNSVDVAGLIEMGVFANYQLVPSVRLTAGYEFWYMPGIVTVPGQSPQIINPSTGTQVDNDNELFLHGGSLGAQIVF